MGGAGSFDGHCRQLYICFAGPEVGIAKNKQTMERLPGSLIGIRDPICEQRTTTGRQQEAATC